MDVPNMFKGVIFMSLTISAMNSSGLSVSTLFSSRFSSSASSASSLSSLISDYNSIKTGSYYKLLSSYYSKVASSDDSTSTTDVKDTTTSLYSLKSGASDLSDAVSALQDSSLYEKKTTTNSDGSTSTDYKWSSITDAVSDFVDSYNGVLKNGTDSSVSGIATNVSSLKNMTSANKSLLSSVGISIKSNGTLSLDEDALKSSDISTVKSLFSSAGGYASMVSANASVISYYAQAATATGYTGSGSYLYSSTASTYSAYI